MLENVFLQILNMCFIGSVVILILLLIRPFMKKLPRVYLYSLWAVALFRLCCPFSIESVISLIPVNPQPVTQQILYSTTPQVDTGIPPLDTVVNQSLPVPAPGASVNPLQIYTFVGSWLWVFGLLVMLGLSFLSFIRLYLRLRKNRVWQPERYYLVKGLETAFVLGILRPKIYLPEGLSEKEQTYILLHEMTHIQRFDPLIKMIAFLTVCLHWFNPLVWIAFFCCGRDMEMSCDEAVIRKLGNEVKKDYASSLLALSTGHSTLRGMPLAFGEGGAKGRIKNVLHYKKPAFWLAMIGLAAAGVLLAGLAVDPQKKPYDRSNKEIAADFASYWLETPGRFDNEMSNGLGKAFLMDVNGDEAPELFFLGDNYLTTTVEIFDISGKEISELGSFEADYFNRDDGLLFNFYRNRSGNALIHYSRAAEGRVWERFVGYGDRGLYQLASLYRSIDANGEPAYYTAPENGEEITWEEYFDERICAHQWLHSRMLYPAERSVPVCCLAGRGQGASGRIHSESAGERQQLRNRRDPDECRHR